MFEKIKNYFLKNLKFNLKIMKKKNCMMMKEQLSLKLFVNQSTKSSTFASKVLVYNNHQELTGLIIKNDLMLMFDYVEYKMGLESTDDFLNVADLTTNAILDILKKEIIEFYK